MFSKINSLNLLHEIQLRVNKSELSNPKDREKSISHGLILFKLGFDSYL